VGEAMASAGSLMRIRLDLAQQTCFHVEHKASHRDAFGDPGMGSYLSALDSERQYLRSIVASGYACSHATGSNSNVQNDIGERNEDLDGADFA
jgi:hypothetical protein